jgi:hypothetical protein
MSAKDALESGRQRGLLETAEYFKQELLSVPEAEAERSTHLLFDLMGAPGHHVPHCPTFVANTLLSRTSMLTEEYKGELPLM